MVTYVLKRVAGFFPSLILGLTLTFFIMRLAPGDPTTKYISPEFQPEVQQQMTEQFGLNDPLVVQYWKWLTAFLQGDFGVSFDRSQPVSSVIGPAITNTLILTVLALFVSLTSGVFFGMISAIYRNTRIDNALNAAVLFLYSMPGFWLGIILILLFSLVLGWLPAAEMVSMNYEYLGFSQKILDRLQHLILPVGVLAATSMASTMRYMRSSMVDILQQDYIRTARAKGIPERLIYLKHAARNAISPVITLFGLSIPYLFSGAAIIEIVFAWPGMGRVMLTAILQRNYPVAIAVTAIVFVMVLVGNLLADVLYAIVDPRIRPGRGART